ncbi:MAG: DUF2845 domain-containing protein [Legionella sp.]
MDNKTYKTTQLLTLIRIRLWLIIVLSLPLMSYAMRCGNNLVYEGDSKFMVLSKCGEPLDKQIQEEFIPLYNSAGYRIGMTQNLKEVWIYQRSPADFQYQLLFDNDLLKGIKTNRNPY